MVGEKVDIDAHAPPVRTDRAHEKLEEGLHHGWIGVREVRSRSYAIAILRPNRACNRPCAMGLACEPGLVLRPARRRADVELAHGSVGQPRPDARDEVAGLLSRRSCSGASSASRTHRLTDDADTERVRAVAVTNPPTALRSRAWLRSSVFITENVPRASDGERRAGLEPAPEPWVFPGATTTPTPRGSRLA